MNKTFFATFSILPVLVLLGVLALAVWGDKDPAPEHTEGLDRELAMYQEVRQRLLDRYNGELKPEDLMNSALKGLANGTGDRYTRVLPPAQARSQGMNLDGRFYGIGVTVNQNPDGSLQVSDVVPNQGASKAGVLPDDVIVKVDDNDLFGISFNDARDMIRSEEKNSKVKLGILRGGDPKNGRDPDAKSLDITVTRGVIEQYSVTDPHIEVRNDRRIGYIRVDEFNENTFDPQFQDALADLQEQSIEGLVVDLRGNTGGHVKVAVEMVDAFLADEDALISFTRSSNERNRTDDHEYRTKDDETLTKLPMVILVDEHTASAAEFVTGALKDHGRAFVVGVRTFGKGLVQTIFELRTDPRYRINITTTQYFTPLGLKVHKGNNGEPGGILPDLNIPWQHGERAKVAARWAERSARYNRDELAKKAKYWNQEDRMLDAALDLLSGKPVTVKKQP